MKTVITNEFYQINTILNKPSKCYDCKLQVEKLKLKERKSYNYQQPISILKSSGFHAGN